MLWNHQRCYCNQSLDGIITSWNKGAEQIYGYSAEEVLGKNVSILEPDSSQRRNKTVRSKKLNREKRSSTTKLYD